MKKLLLLFYCVTSIVPSAFSQAPTAKMWDYIYGGTGSDNVNDILITLDNGFIVCGTSNSLVGGNKTTPNAGLNDYWIIRLDSLGNKIWEKDFGGSNYDVVTSIDPTNDSGYIIGGYSSSNISGDKSENSRGSDDYWIIKIDSSGNKLWDKTIGGSASDKLYSVKQTIDGGFFLAGYSFSGISGDKTQATWGSYDYWVVKTDAVGNKIWDKDLGGSSLDELYAAGNTDDGGIILGGNSMSNISGDKSENNWGLRDYWIVKLDSLGNKIWDKTIGGSATDWLTSIKLTHDGNFILGGYSNSLVSGNKTQGSNGGSDYWIVKADSLGNILWDKVLGGSADDELNKIIPTSDGGFMFAGDSQSGISGDKTENNLGATQTWIIKTDSSGNKIWDKTAFTDGSDNHGTVVQASSNCIIIANASASNIGGYKSQNAMSDDYWLVKLCDTTMVTDISEIGSSVETVIVFPNPVTEKLFVNSSAPALLTKGAAGLFGTADAEISIFNLMGEKIEVPLDRRKWTVDCRSLQPGIYYLEIISDKKIYRTKFIKSS